MNYRELLNTIDSDKLKPLILLYGREKYLINMIIRKLKEKYIDSNFESLNYVYIDGKDKDFEAIKNANETLPFMSEKKMVVVEEFSLFQKKNEENISKSVEEEFLEYIDTLGEYSILVFVVNSEKVDKRRKLIKKIGMTGHMVELNRLNEQELIKWVESRFKKHKKNIRRSQALEFIEYTGYHYKDSEIGLDNLENEIEKLHAYIGERETVESSDIERVVTKSIQTNIFELVDTIGQKQANRSVEILNELLNSEVPVPKILYMIIRQIRLLLITVTCTSRGYGHASIKEKTGVKFDFVIKKLIGQSRNKSEEQVIEWLDYCLDLDRNIKQSLEDQRTGIEKLIIKISK